MGSEMCIRDSLTAAQHTVISNQGFSVHGDDTGQSATAWHSSENVPEREYDWFDLGRRGGSLEKGMSEITSLESELDAGGLVNMYWVGRIHDATVRHDSDVVEMLSQRDDTWFTTWGEAYSYWAVERCNSFNHSLEDSILFFEPIDSVACRSATNAWNVPITWIANISSATVIESSLPTLDADEGNTEEGLSLIHI